MTTLHIISNLDKIALVTELMVEGDEAILIEDCSYLSLPNHHLNAKIAPLSDVYFLKQDLQARGLEITNLASTKIVNMEMLVELTEKHNKSITW